jgi:hypothetical protein
MKQTIMKQTTKQMRVMNAREHSNGAMPKSRMSREYKES